MSLIQLQKLTYYFNHITDQLWALNFFQLYMLLFGMYMSALMVVICICLLDCLKEHAEAKQKKRERKKKDALQTLKSAVIVSGIIVAVAGVAFAITKKLIREK